MALARFKALNVDSSEDSEGDEENPAITREALEEKAAAQYRNILVLQRNKKWKEAEAEFKELLDSDVLNRVSGTVNYVSGRIQPSLIHLKYCLHVNLGHVLIETGQIKEALDSYLQAVELDDRDLNLWYRIGQTAIKIPNLNLAAYALQEALQCNENHWPSLDTLITVLYAAGNYMSCLYHIAEGLKLDADFYKGIAFCQKIFKEHPSYERDFPLYYPECKLDDSVVNRDIKSEVDEEALDRIIEEAEQLRKKHVAQSSQSKQNADCNKVETIRPETPLPKRCWVAVGRTLLHVYAKLKEEYPKASFLRLVDLADEEKAETGEEKDEKKSDYDWYDADDDDNSDDEVAKLTEGGIGPGGGGSDTAMDEGGVNGSVGGGAVRASKRRRSSPSLLDQWMYSSKRRSARVRSTACGRRDEPTLARSLRELLPQYLWPSREAAWGASGDESMDTMDLYRLFESKDNGYEQMSPTNVLSYNERTKLIKEEKYFNTDKEVEDVNSFIKENNLVNILTLITNYVKTVAQKWNLHWSPALIAIYIKVYKLVRQHYPDACQSEPLDTKSANAVLLYGELLLDRWLTNGKERGAPSPLTGSVFGGDFSSLSFGNLAYFCANDVTDDEDAEFVVRCYWLEVIMYLHVKSRDAAMIALERYLADGRCCGVQVKLKNVVNNFTIDEDNVMRLYNTLKRNEDLNKVTDLFARGAQEKACAILKQCLQPSTPLLAADYVDPALDRCTQFSLLLDSLFERGLHADCLAWCELASHEALAQYRATDESSPVRSRWCSLLTNTLVALPLCLEEGDSNLLERLPHWRLVRMIQTMSNVICHQMEAPADSSEIPLGTVAPWIVLYHIVKYDEEKTGRVHDEDDISASLNVLLTAHEYLGKRAWCLIDEAEILYKILGVIIPLMESSGAVTDSELVTTLCHHTEQAFYCLYGHPLKKNKPRHIIEHNAMGLALTWNRSHLVYRYFKPRELPMYDSSVRCSISQDTEALFRRIISLVPGDMDPRRQVEATSAYIEGETDRVPLKGVQLSPQVCDIYYLIADYYFKNKFWSKALRYYALDISANPSRVDSWACLALAHGSQLETKLNSCEPLSSEMDFLRSARMACKCYGRALQLDPEQSTLWIEYGSFSYMVHSFCSRLLKQEPPNLSLELFDALDKQKKQMLDQAYKCFMSANMLWTSFEKKGEPEIQDERWLHHYMFGKIALKREENPEVYLTHFMKAMRYLHQNHAKYPNTVSYSNPQLYCIEALELYYRVHACVLKVLEQSENRSVGPELRRLFFETLEKIASGPFANYGEIISDYFFEDNLSDVPLVESDVCYMLNNMVNIVSGEESVYCKQRLQKRSHIDEGGTDDEPVCKMMKNNEGEAVKCGKESGGSENEGGKVLKREKSKESEVSERENSRDNTDKSEDGNKKLVKKSASQESSSETLSDSDESSSDSDSSSGDSSSEENSNSDSSESSQDSSGGGDNEDDDKEPPKKKMKVTKEVEEVGNWKEEQRSLIDRCLCAMEECQRRFPEHYKSIYRQTYYYFHSKLRNDVNKVRDLLLNEGGLFADRRSTNFFNGVWRIPSSEIDRPGSFAGHMSRCLHLLLDLLRDSKDFKMLLSLALQLKDTPDPDKKYLRDTEREQLAREALSQCVQVLRNKLIEANNMSKLRLIVMEVFKAHRKISKLWPQREKTFNALLTQAYQKYLKFKGDNGNSNFEAASKFCLQEINQTGVTSGTVASSEETVTNNDAVTVSDVTVTVTPTTTTSGATITTVTPTTTVVPSETKVSTAPVLLPPSLPSFPPPPVKRPRGRPSNVSIRQQNPASFLKAAGIPTSKELQMMYQSLSYSKHQLPLMMPPNPLTAGLSLQQQINLQTEFLRQMTSQMAQVGGKNTKQNVPLPSMKPPSFLTEKSPKLPPTFPHSEKSSPKLLPNFPHGEKSSPKLLPNFPHGEKSSSKLLANYPHGEKSSKLPPTFPQSEKSSKLPPTFPQSEKSSKLPPTFPQGEKSLISNFPQSEKPLKQYGKSSKTSSKHTSPHQSTYSKAASSVVQSVSQLRTNPGPVTSMSPSNAPPLGAQSLQHKLLSAKKAKMEKKSTMDPREILLGSSRDPMLGSSSSKLQSRSDVFSKGGRLNDDRFMSMNKSLPKSMTADTKSLLKDLTITPSGFNPDFGSAFSSALNKEDITLTRMPQGNESRIPDLASCSFVDSASKKIKSMFLPHVQPEKHQEPSWKPRAFEPRISSALAAIGTQLTITPTSSAMVHEKKQMAAPMQQMSSDVKYGKAEVSIEPVKEKPKIDPTVITIE